MNRRTTATALAFSLGLAAALLSSCGGGGEDGPLVRLTPNSVTFEGVIGAPYPVYPVIKATLVSGTGTYSVRVGSTNPDVFTASFQPTGATTADILLVPTATAPGTYHASALFDLCRDAGCADVAFHATVPMTYTAFKLVETTASFSMVQGQASAPQTFTVTPDDVHDRFTVVGGLVFGSFATDWLQATRTSASTFSATAQVADYGFYQTTVCLVPRSFPSADHGACIPATVDISAP